MSLLPSYTHIVNPKLKHIYLSFDERGHLLIKSPKVSLASIEKLLLKKSAWIQKSQSKIKHKKGKKPTFLDNDTLYFLGESHSLVLAPYDKKHTKLHFDGDTFFLYYSQYNPDTFEKHIDAFYKKEAQAYLTPLLETWAKRMQATYHQVRFRKTKRQWGSCSSHNDISLNTMMMKLPLDVIEYVVVHELAHITHKHHQKTFWAQVETYLPHYKTQVKRLKEFTT